MSGIDRSFTSPGERRDYWPLVRLALLAALLLLGYHWLRTRVPLPFLDQGPYIARQQRRNDRVLSRYLEALEAYHRVHGSYPYELVDAVHPTRVPGGIAAGIPLRDAWGNRLRYFSDGEIFLLASVGRDGEADTEDYHLLRAERTYRDVCARPEADIVASDRGWHWRCRP